MRQASFELANWSSQLPIVLLSEQYRMLSLFCFETDARWYDSMIVWWSARLVQKNRTEIWVRISLQPIYE